MSQRHSEAADLTAKIVLAGDSSVGKTSLVVRFVHNVFMPVPYIATVGVDFKSKTVNVEGSTMKLQIWDTAGHERFRSMTPSYFRGALGLLLVYDVTRMATFMNVRDWLTSINEQADSNVLLLLLGNKCDASLKEREVKYEEGKDLAAKFGISFIETSAKSGERTNEAFMALSKGIKAKLTSRRASVSLDTILKKSNEENRTKGNCCAT
ncbi:uncharacterized protein [Oscarella lobularis]|uniref:uncharacterized protein n=1 Tax=Oscarella lobularis TaxID=121494 RepID=UPI003313C17A